MKGWPPNGASNYSNHVAIRGFAALKMGDVLLRLFMCHPVNPTYSYFECVRSLSLMVKKHDLFVCQPVILWYAALRGKGQQERLWEEGKKR